MDRFCLYQKNSGWISLQNINSYFSAQFCEYSYVNSAAATAATAVYNDRKLANCENDSVESVDDTAAPAATIANIDRFTSSVDAATAGIILVSAVVAVPPAAAAILCLSRVIIFILYIRLKQS